MDHMYQMATYQMAIIRPVSLLGYEGVNIQYTTNSYNNESDSLFVGILYYSML